MSVKKVVLIGGGTGLSTLLEGLKIYPLDLTAIVTMTDNGASSGKLRRHNHIPPPGDIRKCITALADEEDLMRQLFEHRFAPSYGLGGHSFGNLFLLALCEITGNFETAVERAQDLLKIKGKVIPSTLVDVNIGAESINGERVEGEVDIPLMGHKNPIKNIFIIPQNVDANPRAIQAIQEADLVVIGPGSLYTSVLPNFLMEGIVNAVRNTNAKRVFIVNVSTEKGETEKYTVEDHLEAFIKITGEPIFDLALANSIVITDGNGKSTPESIHNIIPTSNEYKNKPIIKTDLINRLNPLYHDKHKLAEEIWNLIPQNE